jgi:cytosine/adenosine deaminase-related metal-dependent hydrolase
VTTGVLKSRTRRWLAILAAIAIAALLYSLDVLPAGAAPSAFVIRNVRVFDGYRIISANSVLVESDRIRAVGVDLKRLAGAQVIDGAGDTLLPGLIDSHVHAWTRDVLREAQVLGDTTVLDMFMWSQNIRPWKEQEVNGATDIADFRTA